jgi:hypothetical protein
MKQSYYTVRGPGIGLVQARRGVLGNSSMEGRADPFALYTAVYMTLGLVGSSTGIYHGYKRNNSVGWAIGWGIFGGLFPVVALPVMAIQGFGKPKVRSNRRRRRTSMRRRTSRRRG